MRNVQARQARILIIYTGGTVGMIFDESLETLRPFEFEELQARVPEMYKLGHQYLIHAFDRPLDSSNMQPEIWIKLAELIEENYENYDGFVILHGTDTMAFTASALSYLLENLGKPVILTGSQLPIGEIRTDAKENIITAIEIAAQKDKTGYPLVPEVGIYFDFKLFRGNRSKKYDAERFEAFYSMNYFPLAEAGVTIKFRPQICLPHPKGKLKVHRRLDQHIAVLHIFPGILKNSMEAILQTEGLKGVVLESFGAGNTPTDDWFIQLIKDAVDRGIYVLNITQCDGGSVTLGQYETSKYLKEIGVISGFDMTFEAAVTKLMFVLGLNCNKENTKKLLETSLRGELTLP